MTDGLMAILLLISLALQRFEFFGRDAVSLLVILPIALPGIVTGIALNNFFRTILDVRLGIATIIVASTGSSPRAEPPHWSSVWNSTGVTAR